jgi:predicted nucleotidyltransferase component of viral defense system
VRTTITLDDDVAAKLKAEVRRSGRSFKETVNTLLRFGLAARRESRPSAPFTVRARDLGNLRPGLSLDNVSELLERAEGPAFR